MDLRKKSLQFFSLQGDRPSIQGHLLIVTLSLSCCSRKLEHFIGDITLISTLVDPLRYSATSLRASALPNESIELAASFAIDGLLEFILRLQNMLIDVLGLEELVQCNLPLEELQVKVSLQLKLIRLNFQLRQRVQCANKQL